MRNWTKKSQKVELDSNILYKHHKTDITSKFLIFCLGSRELCGSIKRQHSFLQKDASNRTSPLSILLSEFQLLRKELQVTLNSID